VFLPIHVRSMSTGISSDRGYRSSDFKIFLRNFYATEFCKCGCNSANKEQVLRNRTHDMLRRVFSMFSSSSLTRLRCWLLLRMLRQSAMTSSPNFDLNSLPSVGCFAIFVVSKNIYASTSSVLPTPKFL